VNSSLKYILKPLVTTRRRCVSTKTYMVHLNIKSLINLKIEVILTKQMPCSHQEIIKNKMKEGNQLIEILSYIMKENKNIVRR
jgi:hypothetical protein